MTLPLKTREAAYAHHLPYWFAGDDLFVLVDGSMVVGFRLTGINAQMKTDSELIAVAHGLRRALNKLQPGTTLQLLRHAHPLTEEYFRKFEEVPTTDNPIIREQRHAAAAQLRKKRPHTYATYLFLTMPRALGHLTMSPSVFPWIDRFLGRQSPASLTYQRHREAAQRLRADAEPILSELRATRIAARSMTDQEMVDITFRFLNPGHPASLVPILTNDEEVPATLSENERKLYRQLTLREQLAQTSLSWDVTSMTMGDPLKLGRVLSLKLLPAKPKSAHIRKSLELPFEHWLSVSVTKPYSEKAFSSVESRRNRAKSLAAGTTQNVQQHERYQQLQAVLQELTSDDAHLFQLGMHLLVPGDHIPQLDAHTRSAIDMFSRMGIALHTDPIQLKGFLGMLPGNGYKSIRDQELLTNAAADFIPVYEPAPGEEQPALVTFTRDGAPFAIDIDNPRRPLWNFTVFGQSGGGKTFLVLCLIYYTLLARDESLTIVDVGGKEKGSYYRLLKLMGGDFVSVDMDGQNPINPFISRDDLYRGEYPERRRTTEPNDDSLAFLVKITKLVAADPGDPPIGKVPSQILAQAIVAAYQRLGDERPPLFSDVVAELEAFRGTEREDKEFARRAARNIKAVITGPAGKLINQQTKVSIHSKFVVFDLKGLENVPDIAPVVLSIISSFVWNMLARPRIGRAWLIYDECWKALEHPIATELAAEVARTIRKLNGGLGAITQAYEDLDKNEKLRDSILKNTGTTFLLKHVKDHERVATINGLTDRELDLFKDLAGEKGVYSEFLVKQDTGDGISVTSLCQLHPSAFDYWLSTTDPADRTLETETLKKMNGDRLAVLRHLAQHFPNGASRGAPHVVA